jgi:hypothetical protein
MSRFLPEIRPFGQPEDLDLDLEGPDADAVVTEVLTRCSSGRPAESWWNETVGSRIASLVRLVAATERSESLTFPVRCGRPDCKAWLEVPLPLDVARHGPGASARFTVSLPDGAQVVVRAPIGADRRSWRERHDRSRDEAVAAMLETLLIEGHVSASDPQAVNTIAAVLAERDPLVAFTVSYTCPSCGFAHETQVDLERVALDRLARIQRALLSDVHVLAGKYGWTEAEVLAVPAWRRARYRALIEETGL